MLPEPVGARTSSSAVAQGDGGGAVGGPIAGTEDGGRRHRGGRARRDRRAARCRSAGGRRDGCGPEPDRGDSRSRHRSGRGGRGPDGRPGSGGAGAGRAVGAREPGAGGDGYGPAEGVHAAGHRGRLARRVGSAGRQGLRLRDGRLRWRRRFPAGGGSAGCGWTPGPGPDSRSAAHRSRSVARVSRVLALWCMDWPAVAAAAAAGSGRHRPGGGHPGQPGHRLFGGGPRGGVRRGPAPPRSRRPGARSCMSSPPIRRAMPVTSRA